MKYGVWWVSVDKKEQKEYFDSETARMEKIKELMGMRLPWKLIPERGPEKVTTARDVLKLAEQIGGRSLEGLSKSELAKYPKVGDTFSIMGMKVVVVDAEDPY